MTAINFEDQEESAEVGFLAAVMNWAGALLSVLLVAGLMAWAWQLWVRDVTGVPVIKALSGPMRVLPEDPGGLASENRGLTVNRIAEERTDVAPVREVVLVSEPVALDEIEDLAMGALPGATDAGADVMPSGNATDVDEAVLTVGVAPRFGREQVVIGQEDTVRSGTDRAVQEALADVLAASTAMTAGATGARVIPATFRPPPRRPEGLQALAAPASGHGTSDVRLSAIPPGTRLVQFGAYGNAGAAHAEWDRIVARFGDYLVGKRRVVQEVVSGDRTFFRLRATGFVDLADARRFCSV
ncbi:MAG: SPOR domain-containing protein, partial [Boseongicola sp.]|nr:SPOR domain-containing protein [Boseongicola sp.]